MATNETVTEGDEKRGLSSSCSREVLCYPCALRMAILHQLPPPPTSSQVATRNKNESVKCHRSDPLVDDQTHPDFFIAHETQESVQRCFQGGEGLVLSSVKGDTKEERDPSSQKVTWLCVACLGLYQFMDLIFAPSLAASVRRSPFADSKSVSVNISVHRSFTFTWLAAATRYFSLVGGGNESRPLANSIVSEELSNFKDFFVSDLRARVMVYLRHSHEVFAGPSPPRECPGLATYLSEVSKGRGNNKAEEPPLKVMRGGLAERCTTVAAEGSFRAYQAFTYGGENESLILTVQCSHLPTEGVVKESGLPAEYGNNRGDCVLSYGLLYDYVCPYLKEKGFGPPYSQLTGQRLCDAPRAVSTVLCEVSHGNIFLLGNYRKMTRMLSQSPWFSNGKRVGSYSLQEVLARPILPFFFPEGARSVALDKKMIEAAAAGAALYPDGGLTSRRAGVHALPAASVHPSIIAAENVFCYGRYKFHSAGREDVDVRMLGNGRPFVLEIISPSRECVSEADLINLTEKVNQSEGGCVEISHLRLTQTDITLRLARHSESKIKRYRCVIWTSRNCQKDSDTLIESINGMKDLKVHQKTPLRVLHRRSLHTRERIVHSMHISPINSHWCILDIETQAGTYIKEFVHGDLGRTLPNLGTLLHCRADILQLDVLGMTMEDIDN